MIDDVPGPGQTFASEGVYLMRTAQQIQYQLSQMADQKASMLLAATFVIFTVTVSQIHNVENPAPILISAVRPSSPPSWRSWRCCRR